jgi:hypothetical protein
MLSDTALADAARYCDNDLALVLGERLRDLLDVEDELEAAQDTIKELQLKVDLLTCELHDMESTNLI